MSDRHTINKRSKQDEERFKALFRDYFVSMCVFAGRYVQDGELVRDVVHDVFCRLWENPAEWNGVSNVKNYLYTSVRNRCLDVLRREDIHHRYLEWQQKEVVESDEFFETEMLREEVYRLLDESIALLPERSRDILMLKLRGAKNQEIADALNISVNTVNTLKANAYKVLRERLRDKYMLSLLFFLKKVCFSIH